MKKLLLVLSFLLSFVLIGCSKKTVSENTTSENTTTAQQVTDSTTDSVTDATTEPATDSTTTQEITDGTTTEEKVTTEAADQMPVITVEPATVEINAGEEVELLFGVSAHDAEDGDLTVIIADDDDFDYEEEGTYTITYKAVSSTSQEVTATRTIVVNKALSQLTLEVTKNLLGETKWQGTTINFKHELYVEINQDTELAQQSGVFHNTSSEAVTLSVGGTYGVSAIITANGVVVEGRDGANSKLVNAENPTRAGSNVKNFDENTSVASAFAKNMVIPANGYAIVIQANYAGTTADTDGRGFMNYNVIYKVGNVVKLYWADDNTELTTYVNQGPTVSGNTTVYVAIGDTSDINTLVVAGLTATDDNGTFDLSDDTKVTEFTVSDNGGYDVSKAGEYTFTLKCTDGSVETTFTRVVKVLPAEDCATVMVGSNSHVVLKTAIAIDQHLTSVGSYAYLVYTPSFTLGEDETLPANGWGEAFILNEYGEIVVIYDGANGRKFTADHHTLSPTVDTETCAAASYLSDAYAEAKAGGYYLVVAPNSTANNGAGGSRSFLNSNRSWGATMSITGVDFLKRQVTFAVGDKSYTANKEQVVVNTLVSASDASKSKMLIYTKASGLEAITCNGNGVAVVLNKYGKLVRIYDGANGKYFDASNTSGIAASGWTAGTYAADAYAALAEGETLVIFPNDGVNAADSARTFGLSLRSATYIGAAVSLTDFEFEEEVLTFTVGDKSYTATGSANYVVNEVTSKAASMKMLVYTKSSGIEAITCNGNGVAVVLDKYGIVTKIYDGANGKYFDASNTSGIAASGWTAGTYAADAYAALAEGETLVIFPNDGVNAADSARTFALSLRNANYINHVATLTGFTFEDKSLVFAVGDKSFSAPYGTYVVNEITSKAASMKLLVYTKSSGIEAITCNGYGVAVVLDQYGNLIKIYDCYGKYYDADNTTGVDASGWTANTYAVDAYAALAEGETLVIFPNDGVNAADSARAFGLSLRSATYIGAAASLTGFEFAKAPEAKTLKIGSNVFTKDGDVTVAINDNAATYSSADFLIYTSAFQGTIAVANGFGEAFVIKDNKIVRIYDGANAKYYDADNTGGIKDETKCTAALYLKLAIASLGENEWVLCGPNDGGSNVARSFLAANKTIGAEVEFTYAEVETSTATENALSIDNVFFYGATVAVNTNPTVASTDFVIYTYGYAGPVVKNGWCEAFIIDASTFKVVKIYDGVNNKYYDADNAAGVATSTQYALATASQDAFAALAPGQLLVIGLNGGLVSNRARSFMVSNRKYDKVVAAYGITIPAPETTEQNIKSISVDGDRYFVKSSDIKVDAEGSAAFVVYNYGYTGTLISGGYGVALVVDKTTGKVTKVYDGASGKYWDSTNSGVTGVCTAAGYISEAFNSLTENEYVLIAANGSTTGNVARSFLYGHRAYNIAVVLPSWE